MARVKAEYFNAKDKATGEIKEIQFIPPAPSDGDLGGISKEKLEQIDELKGDLMQLVDDISKIELSDGYYANNIKIEQKTASTNYKCAIIRVCKGEKYKVCGTGASTARLWSTHNDDMFTIRKADENVNIKEPIEIEIQDGENYLVFNTAKTSLYIQFERAIGAINEIEATRNEVHDLKESFLSRQIDTGVPIEGFYINSSGDLVGDINTTSYRYIPVIQGEIVNISNIILYGLRCVCAYNSDKSLHSVLATDLGNSKKNLSFKVDGFSYIGVCTLPSNDFNITYNNYVTGLKQSFDYSEGVGNYKKSDIKLNFESGYIDKYGSIKSDTGFAHSFVKVYEGEEMSVKTIRVLSGIMIFCYNKDGDVIETIESTQTKITEESFVVPYGTAYIGFNLAEETKENTSLSYVNKIDRNYKVNNLINGFYESSYGNATKLFNKAKEKPIITFTDDDTVSVASVTAYYNACVNAGIKGTFATLTSFHETQDGLKELLMSYERKGFGVVLHGYTQGTFYKLNNQNIELAEDDFVHGIQMMKDFSNWKYWCTPFGVANTPIRDMAKRWGMECLLTSGEIGFNDDTWNKSNQYGRWTIRRMTLDPTDETSTPITTIKTQIDLASENNGWVIINTHFGSFDSWNSDEGFARFKEVVDYAISKGFEINTLPEAWKIREPIYRFYEMF